MKNHVTVYRRKGKSVVNQGRPFYAYVFWDPRKFPSLVWAHKPGYDVPSAPHSPRLRWWWWFLWLLLRWNWYWRWWPYRRKRRKRGVNCDWCQMIVLLLSSSCILKIGNRIKDLFLFVALLLVYLAWVCALSYFHAAWWVSGIRGRPCPASWWRDKYVGTCRHDHWPHIKGDNVDSRLTELKCRWMEMFWVILYFY